MLHRFGKFRRPVALVMLSVFLVAQLLLPLTARAFFFGGVSLKDEKEMGHKFDVAIRSSLPMVDDPEVSNYVDGLVRRLVKAIPPQPFTFTSGVILHNAMNAFAIPGGHVYVFTGLIMNFEDESQLAGVLSHELAHVTQRHVASRLERAQYLSVGSLLLAIAGVAVGGYNYTRAFMDVASTLSDADLTVLNLEGNICGEPYGSDTTSAPRELLDGLRNAGVDLIQMANSCTINNGLIGLTSTLQSIRAAGLEPVGAFASESEFQQSKGYTITEAQGVKVAFVAFTKGLGGRGLPAGNDNLVNILYEDYASTYDKIDRTRITSVLKAVEAEKPDITIALLHWGSEYNDDISDTQKSIVNLMKKQGVDVIIGTHPHTVQAIEYDELAGTLVAYSLGDFFGDASRGGTNYSIILDLEITKDSSTGTTKVTNYSYTPIYTVSEAESADGYRRVVRIDKTVEAWEENYLDKVSQSAKESMVYALDRIEARINPPVEEKKK